MAIQPWLKRTFSQQERFYLVAPQLAVAQWWIAKARLLTCGQQQELNSEPRVDE